MNEQSIIDRYTLADLERWDEIAREIAPPIRLGVFGDPVAHSLSPQMQNAALRAFEINMRGFTFGRMNCGQPCGSSESSILLGSISPYRTRSRGYGKLTWLMNRRAVAAR